MKAGGEDRLLLADFVVKVSDALVGPVFPQRGQDVAQSVRPFRPTGDTSATKCLLIWTDLANHRRHFIYILRKNFASDSEEQCSDGVSAHPTHLVMVPSISEMMILSSQFHR